MYARMYAFSFWRFVIVVPLLTTVTWLGFLLNEGLGRVVIGGRSQPQNVFDPPCHVDINHSGLEDIKRPDSDANIKRRFMSCAIPA